jgi:triphosphoribosyl-dephospho-CoA synthetase
MRSMGVAAILYPAHFHAAAVLHGGMICCAAGMGTVICAAIVAGKQHKSKRDAYKIYPAFVPAEAGMLIMITHAILFPVDIRIQIVS